VASCGRQQGAINRPEFRPHDLPAQDLELVAQHQQLDVFHMQASTATNKRAEQRPHSEVEKRESHAADPPTPRSKVRRHEYWRPSGVLVAVNCEVAVEIDHRDARAHEP
jgi:hypothetical protein